MNLSVPVRTLVDSPIWIDHLRQGLPALRSLLEDQQVLIHPFVVGELALGQLARREYILDSLQHLPQVCQASHPEVLHLLHQKKLYGLGIGYIDLHLVAATLLTPDTQLWTRDARLIRACDKAGASVLRE